MTPLQKLRHHVTGAIERGEKTAIVEQTASTKELKTATHTPGPYEIGHQLGDGFSIVREVAPGCGLLICLATCHNTGRDLDDETAKANRDFIIRSCNSHAALVTALKEAREAIYETINRRPANLAHVLHEIDAAIHSATL